MSRIAFLGLGNMGAPMAANLVKAGHTVQGFDLVEVGEDGGRCDRRPHRPERARGGRAKPMLL